MSEEEQPQEIKPKELLIGYNAWCKKNMFTVIGIAIILALVIFDYATVQKDKQDLVDKCNDYWFNQVERVCPVLFKQNNAAFDYNMSLTNNLGLGDSNDKME